MSGELFDLRRGGRWRKEKLARLFTELNEVPASPICPGPSGEDSPKSESSDGYLEKSPVRVVFVGRCDVSTNDGTSWESEEEGSASVRCLLRKESSDI